MWVIRSCAIHSLDYFVGLFVGVALPLWVIILLGEFHVDGFEVKTLGGEFLKGIFAL
jgi:hypothetical protein